MKGTSGIVSPAPMLWWLLVPTASRAAGLQRFFVRPISKTDEQLALARDAMRDGPKRTPGRPADEFGWCMVRWRSFAFAFEYSFGGHHCGMSHL
ncbi:hypothetical protein KCP73_23665 [Salmonella enterica subsp. enterica]|nr:hypothetical protein KCP73_23665 [Salmonella enterica subsp. enterica]